jgi:uncharacterized protein (UPF0332 family)/predicted nucleotidyltransferase
VNHEERLRLLHESRTPYLTDAEREVIARVLERLSAVSEHVARVILYGSKVRGDFDAESDIDLLVVTRDGKEQVDAVLQEIEADEPYLSLLVLSAEEYAEDQRLQVPLYVSLQREGVELWDVDAWQAEQQAMPLNIVEGEFRAMDESTKETIRTYLGLAHDGLRAAQYLRRGGFLRDANSKAYYAAHYALVAALYALNVVRAKHSGIEGALSQFLVKPGLVEEEYKDIFVRLRKRREDSDYRPDFSPDEAETDSLIADAERFVVRMERFLHMRGALDDGPK